MRYEMLELRSNPQICAAETVVYQCYDHRAYSSLPYTYKLSQTRILNLQMSYFIAANIVMCLVVIPAFVLFVLVKRVSYPMPLNICSVIHIPFTVVNALIN